MKTQLARSLTIASLLSAGLVGWSGCNAENPDGTKTTVGKIEEAGSKAGHKIEEAGVKAVDATGKGLEKAGEKLETSGAAAVKEHVGEKAGEVVESTGKGLEKAGEKLQDSVKDKKPE